MKSLRQFIHELQMIQNGHPDDDIDVQMTDGTNPIAEEQEEDGEIIVVIE